MKRIAGSGENDFRRFLLAECLEAYADLDEAQKERLQALLPTLLADVARAGSAEAHRRSKGTAA